MIMQYFLGIAISLNYHLTSFPALFTAQFSSETWGGEGLVHFVM